MARITKLSAGDPPSRPRTATTPTTHASTGWPKPRLEVRDLELVLSLGAAGTTAGAAATMHITQSAVSRALTLAEERVGVPLFHRTARGVSPTVAGEQLLAGAAQILGALKELEQRVAMPVAPPARVRMVCECYTAYRWLPSAIASFGRRQSQLELEIAVEHTSAPVDALVRGDIDVALLTTGELPRTARGELLSRPLFSDEVVFVVATSHPLAARPSLTREDLQRWSLITSNAPPAEAHWFLKSVFRRQAPKLQFLRFPLTEAVIDAARAGMGIAVLSEWMASGYLSGGDLTAKRLSSGPLRRPWRIAYRREMAETVERLVTALEGSVPTLYSRAG